MAVEVEITVRDMITRRDGSGIKLAVSGQRVEVWLVGPRGGESPKPALALSLDEWRKLHDISQAMEARITAALAAPGVKS